ncbi:hypothetical protein B296_00000476 [Ensete ventricosum]|uniref:Uncharacterized protein n=1 Tax=Ensete ventricosum TaxID=4639 RepID=A0A427A2E9_ENSVE|nr:hypothetical protein B296_00000476 [Ensete ventricosum]
MDLNVLRKKPRMPSGKSAPAAGAESSQSEVEVIHVETMAKRLIRSSAPDQVTASRLGKRAKVPVRKHKSYHSEGSSRWAAWEKEPEASVEDSSPTYHRPKSMKDLCGMWGHHYQMALLDRVHDVGHLVIHMGNRASLLEAEIEKLKTEGDLEQLVVDKELNELRAGLAESQRQIKEHRADCRKANNELLKLMRENETLKVELSGKSVADYKQSGLSRDEMGSLVFRLQSIDELGEQLFPSLGNAEELGGCDCTQSESVESDDNVSGSHGVCSTPRYRVVDFSGTIEGVSDRVSGGSCSAEPGRTSAMCSREPPWSTRGCWGSD